MNYLNMLLMCAGLTGSTTQTAADGSTTATGGSSWLVIVIYVVIFGAFIYFLMIRPQKKQKQQQENTMNAMQPGDSVLTTSGFYGTIVAINGDTVIVEFGNNKNCRIPMAKQAISQVEKAGAAPVEEASTETSPIKKLFGKKKAEEQTEAKQTEASASSSDSSSSSSEDDKAE